MDAVALRADGRWLTQYSVMLSLSGFVAVMGLSLNSSAVVIGAMLLAPLMTPVLGLSASLSMALPRHLARSTVLVAASSVGVVLIAYLLALGLPPAPLTAEVLARTSPDLRDLIVALAAGSAGAYATVRSDVSSSLPGVAVAVALLPPLATIGVALEAGRGDLAEGATLLYAANLSAIVLVGVLIFVMTGFVPARRLQQKRFNVVVSGLVVAAITVVIAVPLTIASLNAADAGRQRDEVQAAVDRWLGATTNELDEVRVDGDVVSIRISGPTIPPESAELDRAVQQILGAGAATQIRWTQSREPTRTEPAPRSTSRSDQATASVRRVVDDWLSTKAPARFDIARLSVTDTQITVDLVSASPPPPIDELTSDLQEQLGINLPVSINWTQRITINSGSSTVETVRQRIEREVQTWQTDHPELTVSAVRYDGERVSIDLVGPQPADTSALYDRVRRVVGSQKGIDVWFTQRTLLRPATTGS